jgi:hypothetical protein
MITTLFGQTNLAPGIISDSLIQKMKIREVTENWFTSTNWLNPANTSYEQFNENGNRILRVHINYFYHKFVNHYLYDYKKGVIIDQQEYYDWNPYREKRKGDTLVKKSINKYYISTKQNIKTKPNGSDRFTTSTSYDSSGQITQQIDSIKFGYSITNFTFDNYGRLTERKNYVTRNSEKPRLVRIDSLFYHTNSYLISKETIYYSIRQINEQNIYDRVVQTSYKYNDVGLIIEKENLEQYLSLNNSPTPTIHKYEYKFY